jgi:hypothetical protein
LEENIQRLDCHDSVCTASRIASGQLFTQSGRASQFLSDCLFEQTFPSL